MQMWEHVTSKDYPPRVSFECLTKTATPTSNGSASTDSTTGTNTDSTTSTNTNTNTNSTTGGNTYTGDAMANINPDNHQQQQKIISHLPKQQQKK
jgi:hypothetical protein